jgi:glycosyltransferase involved in cell wall biosynthesis
LASLRRLDYPNYEVLVIDNGSNSIKVTEVIVRAGFRCVQECRPGLDWARNRGIEEARNDIISFIDDDATAQPSWLKGIARGFADHDIMAVTGSVLPAELDTESQALFEWYGGMCKGFVPRIMSCVTLSARGLLAAHDCGVGTNMAFRRSLFQHIGRFDTALDVGTPAGGAGDIDIFHRILSAGFAMRYEPSALVWHRPRRSRDDLRRQIYANGQAYSVYLLKTFFHGSSGRLESANYAFRWMFGWVLQRLISRKLRREGFPRDLLWAEFRGALHAPWAYIATMRHDRTLRTAAVGEGQGMDA